MTPNEDDLKESLIRLEAKIDVVLGRHEGKIDALTAGQAENRATLREQDSRIQANALNIAETRAMVTANQADISGLVADQSKRGVNVAAWVAVAVAALAVILDPIMTALIHG